MLMAGELLDWTYRESRKRNCMMTHIIIDTANMFFRARHVVKGDLDTKIGMSMHICLNSTQKVC